MAVYETIFIFASPDPASGSFDAVIDKAKGIVEAGSGTILSIDNWGARPMEYRIGKMEKAIYACMTYTGDRRLTSELEKFLKLTEGVLRTMTVRASEGRQARAGASSPGERKPEKTATSSGIGDKAEESMAGTAGNPKPAEVREHGDVEEKHE